MTRDAAAPRRWRESAVGGRKVRVACVVAVGAVHGPAVTEAFVRGLEGVGFVADRETLRGAVVLRRGGRVGDTLLTATGIAALTSRLGPLSLRAVVVVAARPDGDRVEVSAAMVAGDALAPEIADAIDAAIDECAAAGVEFSGVGWMRSVDLPRTAPGHPRTAAEAGAL